MGMWPKAQILLVELLFFAHWVEKELKTPFNACKWLSRSEQNEQPFIQIKQICSQNIHLGVKRSPPLAAGMWVLVNPTKFVKNTFGFGVKWCRNLFIFQVHRCRCVQSFFFFLLVCLQASESYSVGQSNEAL